MVRFGGSFAPALDFDNIRIGHAHRAAPPTSRLRVHGPDKYKVLEKRRRTAQIKARHALDLVVLRTGDQ